MTKVICSGIAIALSLIVQGCTKSADSRVDKSQCWNPKILRVKVGHAVFDLPKDADFYRWDGTKLAGELSLSYKSYSSGAGNRTTCQKKDHVPLDYGDHVGYSIYSSVGSRRPFLGQIRPYDPQSSDKRFSYYLADVDEVQNIHFISASPELQRGGREATRRLVFGFKQRRASMICQVSGTFNSDETDWVSGTTFPHACSGGIPLRMKNQIVTLADPNMLRDPVTGQFRKQDPELWPTRWHEIVTKINSYRIENEGE